MARGPKHGPGHKRSRAWWAARYVPGRTRCAIGGEVLVQPVRLLDLAHDPADPSRYLGLACRKHNRADPLRYAGKPHPWSKAGRATRRAQQLDDVDDRELERRERIEQREAERRARQQRRTIIVADDADSDG